MSVAALRMRMAAAGAAGFNPLTGWSTDPVHAFWASDPLWANPGDGGAVSSWRNGGSVGTPNATQDTGSAQPTYRASTAAFGNRPTVQFATDDALSANIADISQPFYVVAVASQSAAGTERIFGTGAGSNLLGYGGNSTTGPRSLAAPPTQARISGEGCSTVRPPSLIWMREPTRFRETLGLAHF